MQTADMEEADETLQDSAPTFDAGTILQHKVDPLQQLHISRATDGEAIKTTCSADYVSSGGKIFVDPLRDDMSKKVLVLQKILGKVWMEE